MITNAIEISLFRADCCSYFFDFLVSLFEDAEAAVEVATLAGFLMYFVKRWDTVMPEITHITGANTNIKRTITPCENRIEMDFLIEKKTLFELKASAFA